MLKQIVTLANDLDQRGLKKEANYLDALLRKVAAERYTVQSGDTFRGLSDRFTTQYGRDITRQMILDATIDAGIRLPSGFGIDSDLREGMVLLIPGAGQEGGGRSSSRSSGRGAGCSDRWKTDPDWVKERIKEVSKEMGIEPQLGYNGSGSLTFYSKEDPPSPPGNWKGYKRDYNDGYGVFPDIVTKEQVQAFISRVTGCPGPFEVKTEMNEAHMLYNCSDRRDTSSCEQVYMITYRHEWWFDGAPSRGFESD